MTVLRMCLGVAVQVLLSPSNPIVGWLPITDPPPSFLLSSYLTSFLSVCHLCRSSSWWSFSTSPTSSISVYDFHCYDCHVKSMFLFVFECLFIIYSCESGVFLLLLLHFIELSLLSLREDDPLLSTVVLPLMHDYAPLFFPHRASKMGRMLLLPCQAPSCFYFCTIVLALNFSLLDLIALFFVTDNA